MQLLVLAIAPLVWIPLAGQFGRRPIWVLTVLCAAAFNVGNAFVNSYAAHMTMRVFVAVFISPGIALGQGVVMETFFKEERGQKMVLQASGDFKQLVLC
jgi:MFS family permease